MTSDSDRTLAILGYHKIGKAPGDWDTWFYIPKEIFVEQLRYMRESGWQMIDAAAFLRGLDAPETLPRKTALVTFDDGCRQFLDVALPCLRRFECPAVHFVPTNYIGKENSFDAGIEPEEPIFTWTDLREVERWGVSIQSHAASHRAFSELTQEQQEEEVRQSRDVLEAGLRKRIELFAYPQGDEGTDPTAIGQTLQRTGYRAACLYGGGPVPFPVKTPYRLTRLAMGPDTDLKALLGNGRHMERES
jgi:peptidoglycan/xylan/chitin deacetylase (PgdA/CDA1 family)